MKKLVMVFLIGAFLLLMTACGQEEADTEDVDSTVKVAKETEPKEDAVTIEPTEEEIVATEDVEEAADPEPAYTLQKNWNIAPIDPEGNEKVVLLTIDDAPDKHALQMAKTLKNLDAEAIFFVNGHFLDTEEEKEILKQIYDMGFEIGNHTYNHQALPEVDQAAQEKEIIELSNLVKEITGEAPKFFRAPHGMNTDFSRQLVENEGMLLMNWTYGYDWEQQYMTADAISDIMVNTELLSNGSNLLMHDREWTSEGLKDIVEGLREKGFEILDPDLIETPSK